MAGGVRGSVRLIVVENLACRRSGRLIFDRLSFALAAGEACWSPGATAPASRRLLAILAGRLRPEAGTVVLEGAGERTLPECLHVVGHHDGLKTALTAEENLAFAQRPPRRPRAAAARGARAVGLGHAAALPVAYLSAGQRRRVALARLLVAAARLAPGRADGGSRRASQERCCGLMRGIWRAAG